MTTRIWRASPSPSTGSSRAAASISAMLPVDSARRNLLYGLPPLVTNRCSHGSAPVAAPPDQPASGHAIEGPMKAAPITTRDPSRGLDLLFLGWPCAPR